MWVGCEGCFSSWAGEVLLGYRFNIGLMGDSVGKGLGSEGLGVADLVEFILMIGLGLIGPVGFTEFLSFHVCNALSCKGVIPFSGIWVMGIRFGYSIGILDSATNLACAKSSTLDLDLGIPDKEGCEISASNKGNAFISEISIATTLIYPC